MVNYTVGGFAASTDYAPLSGGVVIPAGKSGATIFVNPINDADIEGTPPETVTLTLSANSNYSIGTNSATITINDDDVAGVRILQSGTRTDVVEGGDTDTYDLSLTARPSSNVTINFNTGTQISSIPAITFTPANWNIAQTVTVAAVDDNITEGAHTGTITHTTSTADTNYSALSVGSVTANISDPILDGLAIASGLETLLNTLEQSYATEFLSAEIPIFGDGEQLVNINPFAEIKDLLLSNIRTATALTPGQLELILETSLAPLFPTVNATVTLSATEATFTLDGLDKTFNSGALQLAEDFNLPGLDMSVDGDFQAQVSFSGDLGFGISKDTNIGFFVNPTTTSFVTDVDLSLSNNFATQSNLGVFRLDINNDADNPTVFDGAFTLGVRDTDGSTTDADGNRLTLTELQGGSNPLNASFVGNANLGLEAKTSIAGDAAIPSFLFDFEVDFPSQFSFSNGEVTGVVPTVSFNNLQIDLGTFITQFAAPVVQEINPILEPIRPIISFLNADTKLFSALGIASLFDQNGDGKVSVIELAATLSGQRVSTGFFAAIEAVSSLVESVDELTNLLDTTNPSEVDSIVLDLGSYNLTNFDPLSGIEDALQNAAAQVAGAQGILDQIDQAFAGIDSEVTQPTPRLKIKATQKKVIAGFTDQGGLNVPLLTNPFTAVELLLGKPDVDLFVYDLPKLEFGFEIQRVFPIYPPFALAGLLEGSFNLGIDIGFGFDSLGLSNWRDSGFQESQTALILDGFFISDRQDVNGNGILSPDEDINELTILATIAAGFGLDFKVVSGFLKGGVEGIIGIDFLDVGEVPGTGNQGTDDGKIRFTTEIFTRQFSELFQVLGVINAFLGAEINVLGSTVFETRFATFPLAQFTIEPNGATFGAASDGYITGATVFFDANFNGIQDFADFNGNDIIYSKGGRDSLFGGNGNDTIYSGGGSDFIDGGVGNDTIYLSGGRNIAVMKLGEGTDTIIGYRNNVVQFDLEQLTFGQLTIAQTGKDVQIRNGLEVLAVLTSTQVSSVTASNFI